MGSFLFPIDGPMPKTPEPGELVRMYMAPGHGYVSTEPGAGNHMVGYLAKVMPETRQVWVTIKPPPPVAVAEAHSKPTLHRNFFTALRAQREILLTAAAEREAKWVNGYGEDPIHRANLEIVRRLRAAADSLVSSPFDDEELA